MDRPGRGRTKVLLHSHQAGALDRSSILIPFHHTATASDPKTNKTTAGREEQVQYTAFSLPNPSLDIYVSSTLHLPSQSPKQIRLTSSQVQPLLASHMASIKAQFPTFLKVFDLPQSLLLPSRASPPKRARKPRLGLRSG